MEILKKVKARARQLQKLIILPESEDERVLKAAKIIIEEKLAKIILLSNNEQLKDSAVRIGLDLANLKVIDPVKSVELDKFSREFYELRQHKGITLIRAREKMHNFIYFAAMMVRHNLADGFVGGATHTTADVAKASIYCIGFGGKVKTVSSCFLVIVPDCIYGKEGIFIFADCGIVPTPSAAQLANIAKAAADFFELLVESQPRVALLSFSSKGSATHPLLEKVVEAKQIIEEKFPGLVVDGELQLDAAIVPEVAKRKAPESQVAGSANVLIFPSLEAGNIGYKLVQRLAKADVIGPMMIGLKKPCSDLSRGCTVAEIVNAVCATSINASTL